MGQTGIRRIDDMFAGDVAATPIGRGDTDAASVGVLQDLLIGHGARLAGILDRARGQFGPQTEAALSAFQLEQTGRATG